MKSKLSKQRSIKKKKKIIILGGLFLVCLLIIAGIVYASLSTYVNKVPKNKICQGVYIGDVNVSEMTKKEAAAAVDAMREEYKQKSVVLSVGNQTAQAGLEELGFGIKNEEKLVEQALNYGKTGNVWKRYCAMKKLQKVKKVIQPSYMIDKDVTNKIIEERCLPLATPATNATITHQGDAFVITNESEGETLDVKASTKKVETFLNTDWHGKSGTIKMSTVVQAPTLTAQELSSIKDLLGSYTTYCGSGGGRVQNIETGASHINGVVIMPGEEYSANAAMEPYTAENGYAEAGSYEEGKVVQSMGGGICQVSTTLYNALLYAELEITQRLPHSMLVGYVKPSRDAAIAGDYKDLKFLNNTESPILIESVIADGNLTFSVYGKETRAAGRTVDYESETTETTEPAGKKFVAAPEETVGYINTTSAEHVGLSAQLWKIIAQDGVEISREVINHSNYEASGPTISVGTMSANA
ncbi:MAG: VanW family protein, partial [Lachnospiraceae bacterium]|nr:VanW family protein [Lachnospiraceae bacterium]